jgi:hypothetical protein
MAVEEDEEAEALGRGRRRKKLRGEPVASKKLCAGTVRPAGKLQGGARRAVKKKKAAAVKNKKGQRAGTFAAAEEEEAGKLGSAVKKKNRAARRPEAWTEFLGVSRALNGKYGARIGASKGIVRWLGCFDTAEDAARAYDAAAVELHGASAVTNFKSSGDLSGQATGSVKIKVKKQANSRSGIRGVCRKPSGRYSAHIWVPSRRTQVCLGTFGTAEEAARAYDAAAIKLHGRAASTNFEQQPTAASADDGEVSSMDFLDDFPELPALDFPESLIPGPQKDDLRTDSSPAECLLVHEFLKEMGYPHVVA